MLPAPPPPPFPSFPELEGVDPLAEIVLPPQAPVVTIEPASIKTMPPPFPPLVPTPSFS